MAIEVKIPTILRSYTGGAKAVEAKGDTLAAVLDDLDANHNGLKGRLVTDDGSLHRFVNVYVNDEDVRFTGSLETPIKDGDTVTVLPAVAGGSRESGIAGGSRESGIAGGSRESGIAGGSRESGIAGGSRESGIAGGSR